MNFYKQPLSTENGYRYLRVAVGDKYAPKNNSEDECKEMKNELYSLGVKSNIGCNNGMWSVAVTEVPLYDVFVRMFDFVE